jgi:hypothetical protein
MKRKIRIDERPSSRRERGNLKRHDKMGGILQTWVKGREQKEVMRDTADLRVFWGVTKARENVDKEWMESNAKKIKRNERKSRVSVGKRVTAVRECL